MRATVLSPYTVPKALDVAWPRHCFWGNKLSLPAFPEIWISAGSHALPLCRTAWLHSNRVITCGAMDNHGLSRTSNMPRNSCVPYDPLPAIRAEEIFLFLQASWALATPPACGRSGRNTALRPPHNPTGRTAWKLVHEPRELARTPERLGARGRSRHCGTRRARCVGTHESTTSLKNYRRGARFRQGRNRRTAHAGFRKQACLCHRRLPAQRRILRHAPRKSLEAVSQTPLVDNSYRLLARGSAAC